MVLGAILIVVGALISLGDRLPFRLGRLPGDIAYHGKNTSFYFPVVTCIVISIVLSLIAWLFRR